MTCLSRQYDNDIILIAQIVPLPIKKEVSGNFFFASPVKLMSSGLPPLFFLQNKGKMV